MAAGRFCDSCSKDLYETDPNERISLVPQAILGLWPIIRDTQEQLDFCGPKCAAAWFTKAAKNRPGLLKKEAQRDVKERTAVLEAADRSAEIMRRLTEIPAHMAVLQSDPGGAPAARALEQERHALVRELNDLGRARPLGVGSASAAGALATTRGPRGRSGKTPQRR